MSMRLWSVDMDAREHGANDARINELTATLEALNTERKAKMMLVKNEADAYYYAAILDDLRDRINATQMELDSERAKQSVNWVDVGADAIRRLQALKDGTLEKPEYRKLVELTFRKITVHPDKLEIELWMGATVDIPRIKINGRGTLVFPQAQMVCAPTPDMKGLQGAWVVLSDPQGRCARKLLQVQWEGGECHIAG